MNNNPYHFWSLGSLALGAVLLPFGGVMSMHGYGYWPTHLVVSLGISLLFFSIFIWWRYDHRKLAFQGDHTAAVQMGLGFGIILFITSGMMFFVAFFWPFFNSSFAPILEIKTFCSLKVVNFGKEWTAAEYGVVITLLTSALLWGLLPLIEKYKKSTSNIFKILPLGTFIVGLLGSFTLFCLEPAHQKEIYKNIDVFLGLSLTNKISLVLILWSLLVAYYVFQEARRWIIKTYSITLYYVLVIGVRAGFLFYKVDVQVFLSVEVGLIIVALVWVFCKRKPEAILEWGKLLVELVKVGFYMQLTLMGAYFLAVLLCQPSPCFWVYTNAVFLLFEATLCLGKVLAEMTSADGVLWEKVRSGVEEIKTLVSPDYIPAFQGGEELAQEQVPEKEVPDANTSRMMPAPAQAAMTPLWPVQQGGQHFNDVGPWGDPLWTEEEIVSSLEGNITIPLVPMAGISPSTIVINDFMQYPRDPGHLNFFPPATRPVSGFIPGGFLFGDPNLNEVPNTPWGSLLNYDYPTRMQIFDQIRQQDPYLVNHLSNGRQLDLRYPRYIVNLTNLAGTKGGFYLRLDFYRQLRILPCYYPANDLEMLNGENYKRINMSLFDLKNYLESDSNLRHFASRLVLRRDMGSYIKYGGVGFRRAEHLLDLQPNIPGLCVNGIPFYWAPRN